MKTTPAGHFPASLPALTLTLLLLTGCEWEIFTDSDDRDRDKDPTPSAESRVTGAELGVSSIEASLPVYTDGLGMEVISEVDTSQVRQVTLASENSPFTARLTLTQYLDGVGRPLDNNPGKIVFFTPDATELARSFANAGGDLTLPPEDQEVYGRVGFGRDPDRNLIEFSEQEDAEFSYFAAFGLGASNLEEARDFWQDVVGLEELAFLKTDRYDEYILGTREADSLPLVLMHWTDDNDQRYRGNETRVRVAVSDPEALALAATPEGEDYPQDPDGNRLIIQALPEAQQPRAAEPGASEPAGD